MKRMLRYNPGNLLGEMKKKIVEKDRNKDKAEKKKKVVEVEDVVVVEDRRPDVDEEPADRKRKREELAAGVDPFEDSVFLHFPAEASIIQEPGKCMREVEKLLLKEDQRFLGRLSLAQLRERTLSHLIEAAQTTMVYDNLIRSEEGRRAAVEKKLKRAKVEHGEKERNLEERIKSLKQKADEYDDLYNAKLSVDVLLSAVREENKKLKSENEQLRGENKKLSDENQELDASVMKAQQIGGLSMEKFMLEQYLEHGGNGWNLEEKIREIVEFLAIKGISLPDNEAGEQEGDEGKEEEEEGEKEGENKEEEEGAPPAEEAGDD